MTVSLVFTSQAATAPALRAAANLAQSLGARLRLIVPQIVPYPLPLDEPPVAPEVQESRFCRLEASCKVEVYLCRERHDAFAAALLPHSLVVIGARKAWWAISERRMAHALRRAGHEVIVWRI